MQHIVEYTLTCFKYVCFLNIIHVAYSERNVHENTPSSNVDCKSLKDDGKVSGTPCASSFREAHGKSDKLLTFADGRC